MENSWTTRFDHLLADMEAGRVVETVITLSGMLDAITDYGEQLRASRQALLRHTLYRAIASPPAQAAQAELGFARASQSRKQLSDRLIDASQRAGHSMVNPDSGLEVRNQLADIVFAPSLADKHNGLSLTSAVQRLAHRLLPSGRLVLSAFTPGHLGLGWRRVVLGEDVHCHDEADFAALARTLDLAPTIFRDGSGNLIWAEFSRIAFQENKGKTNGCSDPYQSDCGGRPRRLHAAVPEPAEDDVGIRHRIVGGR